MLGRKSPKVEDKHFENGYVYALTGRNKVNDSIFSIPDSINAISTKLSILSKDGKSYYSSFFRRSDHYSFYQKYHRFSLLTEHTKIYIKQPILLKKLIMMLC